MQCELCGLEVEHIVKHHLIPRQKGGKNKVDNKIVVCLPCSKQVHALHSNYELKRKFDTLDKLKQDERVQKWIRWRRKHSRIEDIRYSQKEN